ncbi:MAG: L-seryl-tRNA(Sec) selenium transferase [Deltaproteobacteria bacterium]|nr:L-seryl-tRNA(Sec) selenium transferase [Deltaproteobacteria bacterium]
MEITSPKARLRALPSVSELLLQARVQELLPKFPRSIVLNAIREALDALREKIMAGDYPPSTSKKMTVSALLDRITDHVNKSARPHLQKVINATGIIIHTNLGRAPLSSPLLEHLCAIAGGYCNLEYDLEKGERGSRHVHMETILKDLTGAESALVVNNNAAAVLVTLNTLAASREVIVSRGELIEIGGAFRLPDVMKHSGCILREVGTTNRTRLSDYREAISPETALLLTSHTSNYRILGFTEQVPLKELATLGRQHHIAVVKDLGSGSFVDLSPFGLKDEPTVSATLRSGVDLVTFSGDKLLGGPQAGVIVGKKKYLDPIKQNALLRAVRIDKFTVAALEYTLREYQDIDKALRSVPVLQMLACPLDEIKRKAARLYRRLKKSVADAFEIGLANDISYPGGGALPLQSLPTRVVTLVPKSFSVTEFDNRLRQCRPPIIARVSQEKLIIDVRTVFANEIPMISQALETLL